MKIYMDNCCYNRPFDGYTDDRSMDEVAAIKAIIEICKEFGYPIIGSPVVIKEIDKTRKNKPEKWKRIKEFYNSTIDRFVELTPEIILRGQEFLTVWPQNPDCYHLAIAEAAFTDFLMTTDDRFEKANARLEMSMMVRVINPVKLLEEIENGSGDD